MNCCELHATFLWGVGAVHEGLCAESTFRMQEPEAENWEETFSYFST